MIEPPTSFQEAREAAEKAIAEHEVNNPGQPMPSGPDPHTEAKQATEEAGVAAAPEAEGAGSQKAKPTEAKPANDEIFSMSLKDGETLEMTIVERDRLLALGLEAGDEGFLNDAKTLQQFASKNPGAAKVLDKIMSHLVANPGQEDAIVQQLGITEEAPEATDPRDKEIADLRAELAEKKGTTQQSLSDQLRSVAAEKKAAYPALRAYSDDELVDRLEVRLHRGMDMQQAVSDLVRTGVSRETSRVESKVKSARRAQGLRGTAAEGSSATSVAPPKQMSGDDLLSGGVRKGATDFLRRSGF